MSGVRWWELRSPDNNPVIFQEGTYAPGLTDGIHRWMGSIAMNSLGDIALGFSAANDTNPSVFPSVFYTARHDGDPPGEMTLGEGSIVNGTGSQTGSPRWGDYTAIDIDPIGRHHFLVHKSSTSPRLAPLDGDCESARLISPAEEARRLRLPRRPQPQLQLLQRPDPRLRPGLVRLRLLVPSSDDVILRCPGDAGAVRTPGAYRFVSSSSGVVWRDQHSTNGLGAHNQRPPVFRFLLLLARHQNDQST